MPPAPTSSARPRNLRSGWLLSSKSVACSGRTVKLASRQRSARAQTSTHFRLDELSFRTPSCHVLYFLRCSASAMRFNKSANAACPHGARSHIPWRTSPNDRMLVACCGCLDATVAWHHQRGTAFASCECGKSRRKIYKIESRVPLTGSKRLPQRPHQRPCLVPAP